MKLATSIKLVKGLKIGFIALAIILMAMLSGNKGVNTNFFIGVLTLISMVSFYKLALFQEKLEDQKGLKKKAPGIKVTTAIEIIRISKMVFLGLSVFLMSRILGDRWLGADLLFGASSIITMALFYKLEIFQRMLEYHEEKRKERGDEDDLW